MKFTRQFDQMDCGPACIRMVASAYGKEYPLSYLRSIAHLTREGVSVAGIRDALREIGMESAAFEMTTEQLREKCPLPAILHWEQNHFVVLTYVKKSRTGGWKYRVANPAYGQHTFSEEAFAKFWLNGEKGVVIAMEPTEDFHLRKPVKEKHSFIRFGRKYVWPFRRELAQSALGMLAGLMLSLVTPFLTQAMVDDGIGMRNMGLIVNIMLAQIFLFIGSFSMGLVGSWVSLYMSTRISINILTDYLTKLLRLPMTFFDTKSVGDYHQRLGDHGRLQSFVTYGTLQTFFALVSAPFYLAIIGWYSPVILAAYLLFTAAGMAWMAYFFRRRKALDYEQFKLSAENQNKQYELMSGITDIKLNAYEDYKLGEWQALQERQYRMSRRALRLGQVQDTGFTLIGQLRNIFITCWIAAEVVDGNLTLGMMMSISAIIGQVSGPLSQLTAFLQQFQDAKISLERSEEVHLCHNEDTTEMDTVPAGAPLDIEVNHLTFSYTGSIGRPALEDVSLTIPAGSMTAIVGESGSGKTTLMKLLLKFYEPTAGEIRLGGKPLAEYSAHSMRRAAGIVMQDNFIFSDTVRRNIVLGEEEDEHRLSEAVELACLTDYVKSHPLGTHTKVGAEGTGVSGGEKQRMMIARAIYKNPCYLMLDEATSSLDAENERRITDNLSRRFAGRTRIVIAHRLSTVRNADNIVVLRHGRVAESGTHRQLVALKGYYYELIRNQLELAD
ncbi:lactococcin-G-processing and transport ATP-binding protein LagD [Bacteroidaceae bacterium]|jgi:ATP-binding cassette subfamily B protein|uniref:peptidase domain-containing ABC transporter n=1 Tax=Prevotella sp. MGM2 TaxID=2033406 RepID=UPI000CEA4D12|nr:peptidase domain-containing ABC transporter [Prevotella sp. MGM2]GAY30875.1 peptide-transporting ATPase [Prevotella sp. MGM2]GFI35500.1 lactococcin-G-processing and transport ATP-binding protein LagD [Bacteroidaceae bacterium]